jgi:hypothetical protein
MSKVKRQTCLIALLKSSGEASRRAGVKRKKENINFVILKNIITNY